MAHGLASVIGISAGLILVACTDDPAPLPPAPDAGVEDAGVEMDASVEDMGVTPDAAVYDGGPNADGGIIDLCNPVAQTGCMTGEKCVVEVPQPTGTFGAHCIPVGVNDQPFGDPCTDGGRCQAGLACIRPTSTATSARCVMLCDPISHMPCENIPGDWECASTVRMTNWKACVELQPVCDPYTQMPCLPAQACQPYQHVDMSFDFRCRTAGAGGDNAACGGGVGCQRGLACVRDSGTMESHCKILCQLNTDCPNMRQCNGSIANPVAMYCGQ